MTLNRTPGKKQKEQTILDCDGRYYTIYSLDKASGTYPNLSRLPLTLRILAENLLRRKKYDGLNALNTWAVAATNPHEITFLPARVLMQDFTGVPALADLAAMRDAKVAAGEDPQRVNPLCPVDLVIDHSVTVDRYGTKQAFSENVAMEFERNAERYKFLKWGQHAFRNFRVVPPGTGICHQVNLEYLAKVVWTHQEDDGTTTAYPDTLVGMDSHTPMVNGLSVLGWGVGGIEAEAAMLGQPLSMLIPDVIGFKLSGKLPPGCTATDLVLTITELLRARGVVGKFVEFFGEGLADLTLADRATIANMAPEYGATCGYFPVDEETLRYLHLTGRDPHQIKLVEAYAKEQGLWRRADREEPIYTEIVTLDCTHVEPCVAGPKRPQDRIPLAAVPASMDQFIVSQNQLYTAYVCPEPTPPDPQDNTYPAVAVPGHGFDIGHGHVVIAAITSCTNTSNPAVMVAAGLLAKRAVQLGLTTKPWVKTSLAPGSQVVTDYLEKAGLQGYLDTLGFNLVGYGCTTCIGNSGPLAEPIMAAIEEANLTVCSVLSGNRNFDGRINPSTKASFLASPPLVVAYALAGSVLVDITQEPLGRDADGHPIFLKDIWPSNEAIQSTIEACLDASMFQRRYQDVDRGPQAWRDLPISTSVTYDWQPQSTYIRKPPFLDHHSPVSTSSAIAPDPGAPRPSSPHDSRPWPVQGARTLLQLGDSITTDHISPAGAIRADSPAGLYLREQGVQPAHFNAYGARRGNHEVMVRGTFANIRLQNELTPHLTGGMTRFFPTNEDMTVYEAAQRYRDTQTPLIVVAGWEYGTGSSRDWAAKGPKLLGVRAVIAESFERIHRSNLVGMGILPLTFLPGSTRYNVANGSALTGQELWTLPDPVPILEAYFSRTPRGNNEQKNHRDQEPLSPPLPTLLATLTLPQETLQIPLTLRVDTKEELAYFTAGGILPFITDRL